MLYPHVGYGIFRFIVAVEVAYPPPLTRCSLQLEITVFDGSFSSDRYALMTFHAGKKWSRCGESLFSLSFIVKFSVVSFVRFFHMLIL